MHPIYVDVSDEITTVIERMKNSSEKSLALVVPKGALLLQSIVNLKLAKKAAADADKKLTLITTDKVGRNLAAQIGLTTLSRIDANPEDEPELSEAETNIVDGVKIHRYYDEDKEDNQGDSETEVLVDPIIPREIMQETPNEEPEMEPIMVKEIVTEIPEKTSEEVAAVGIIEKDSKKPEDPIPESTTSNEPSSAKNDKKPEKKKRNYRKSLIFAAYIILLLILASGAVGAFYLPKTTVILSLPSKEWSEDISLVAKNTDTALVTEIVTAETEESLTFKATGSKEVGSTASGTAKIFNGYSSTPQSLPAGATIAANGLNFITQNAITIPGAQVQGGVPVAGSANVDIVAAKPGPDYNMTNVTGTVPSTNLYSQIIDTNGGSSKQVAVITQTDIANAKNALTKQTQETLATKIQETYKDRSVLFDDKSDAFNLDSFTTTQPSGAEADSAQASGKASLKRLIVDQDKALEVAKSQLKETQDTTHTYVIQDIKTTALVSSIEDQSANLTIQANGRYTDVVPFDELRSQLAGKNKNSAESLINLVVKDAKITITRQPTWWPNKNFPYSKKYLEIVSQYE